MTPFTGIARPHPAGASSHVAIERARARMQPPCASPPPGNRTVWQGHGEGPDLRQAMRYERAGGGAVITIERMVCARPGVATAPSSGDLMGP
jgi:hypothetical protein